MYLEKILKFSKNLTENSEILTKSADFKELRSYSPFRPKLLVSQPVFHDFTLKQTKESIEELYLAKAKYDKKCLENMQPKENFDNFVNIHLATKYGLKSLCTQWLNLFNKALVKFGNDIEVQKFKKFKTEVNEDSFWTNKDSKEKGRKGSMGLS